ncbi:MAG: hypothetical protein V1762_01150 [Nitrospirota bacterium]|nr:hypothetical protein [Nitrospirota bacterium]
MFEQRQFERKPYTENLYCVVSIFDIIDTKILNLVARGVDTSEGGIGIKTDYPLEPGHVLRLHNSGLPKKFGFVSWSRKGEIKDIYRVGIKFV